ncbi:MAG: TlpA disulfide reductase family protein [Phycisphaerales bacterium]
MKRLFSLVAVAALGLTPVLATAADVVRDSTGDRRVALDKLELRPFPAVWDGLTDWTGGEPLKSGDLDGKPALLVNWASWNAGSVRALATAQRMAEKFGGQGLIVVGIHHPQGWDGAAEAAKSRGVTFPIALDKDGAYRKALVVVREPEFYVMDRAGHLRYATVAAGSVEEAVAEVTSEDAAKAGDVPRILRERAELATAQGKRMVDIRTNFELQTLPAVPPGYLAPDEAAYKGAAGSNKWPRIETEIGKAFGILNQDGKNTEPKLGFEPVAWHPRKPETAGRLQVIYFWHPEVHLSYNNVLENMDTLQEQLQRDIAITGAIIGEKVLDPQKAQSQVQTTPEEEFDKLRKKWEGFVKSRKYSHALAVDLAATCLSGLNTQQGGGKFPLPGALIASTDGTIRWIGWTMDFSGRWDADFRAALDKCIASDPGVQLRKKLDRQFIEKKR